ncbi:putative nadh-dependent flavin oxidoreductase oxidoreductase protein [Oceanicola granulosus HTCC2516]|uniref:Putative nadh-dependent flavin oxidoreductase oxidoreductase protein n=1 Tax=Oceanicola granulosus (strain ATCC BAA-861 / DSM 15982 / KCTC 12143 / HTCC2516) TaxID=314256 RepID=Q2CJE0_OCEGH|nr:NADH:flavin oxidoreductase/NADH oxidase [Oceanicola granulosus]EAR52660.1 putative nadh-dependent flavin oxidoreductase oxidoreductase protein [Oceanicola granulosus HTCC2516]
MTARLFTPFHLRDTELDNRIVIAPMCQYSAEDGLAGDWHELHWGQLALSRAGLLMIEATGVSPEGRISAGCLGLWNDAQEAAIAAGVAKARAVSDIAIGIQLAHAGRKASVLKPWEGKGHLAPGDGGWQVVGPSAVPFAEDWPVPHEMSEADIAQVVDDFAAATRRAVRLGMQAIEIHAAHGYLLSSYLSPLANRRTDHWGGSLENRMRLPLAVLDAVRAAAPETVPVAVRLNGTDWIEGGIHPDEAVALARALREHGCDLVDVSSGGNGFAQIPVGPGYQVPVASRIRREVGIATMAVGLIRAPQHAEAIVAGGEADLVALGRGILNDPRWPWHAAEELGVPLEVAPQYRFGATTAYRPTWGR